MSHKEAQKAQEKHGGWYALDVQIEPDAREAVEYALMEAGALGTETTDRVVTAYFEDTPNRERIRNELFDALRIYNLPSSSVRDMSVREIAQRDWLEEWKRNWQPVEVGRFIIAPPWSELGNGNTHERLVIRIEPGMAFGTGTHETTRLCLQAIQKHFSGGSFLDVGTGTGILAIAAAKLFPEARIEAFDTDEEAIAIARDNAAANNVQIEFRVGSVNEATASAELVCANLTADVIVEMIQTLVSLTCGKLVLSGILETQIDMVQAALYDCGISEFEVAQDGEWVVLII